MLSTTNALNLYAAADTDPGRVHPINQDTAAAAVRPNSDEAAGLFIVADGMGGHQAGEIASQLAVKTIKEELAWFLEETDDEDTQPTLISPLAKTMVDGPVEPAPSDQLQMRLQLAIERANRAIADYAQSNPIDAGNLGTTVTCALIDGSEAVIANVGDSRTYLLRDGKLQQVTEDHSYVARLVKEGQIKPEEIFDHPRRNVITRSLGHKTDIEVDTWSKQILPGDRLLLCSDGLWEMIQDSAFLEQQLRDSDDPSATVAALIEEANRQGGADNIGVVVVHIEAG